MMGREYFKGRDYEHGHRHIFIITDEADTDILTGDPYNVTAVDLNDGSNRSMMLEKAVETYAILRRIPQEEFDTHYYLAILQREIFNNQFVGGFPREKSVLENAKQIQKYVQKTLQAFSENDGRDERFGSTPYPKSKEELEAWIRSAEEVMPYEQHE